MKTDYDTLPQWMKADGFSWDEIIAELKAEKPPVSAPEKNKKSGCKPISNINNSPT